MYFQIALLVRSGRSIIHVVVDQVVDGKLGFKIVAPDLQDNFGWKVHNNFFPNKLDHQSSFYWVMFEINL